MLKFVVDFPDHVPNKKQYSQLTIDQIYEYLSYEAKLTIACNNLIIFSEEVAIVEFFWYLSNWYKGFRAGNKDPFIYTTVEFTAPILEFSASEINCWRIDSIWKRCDEAVIVDDLAFSNEIDRLIRALKATLEC